MALFPTLGRSAVIVLAVALVAVWCQEEVAAPSEPLADPEASTKPPLTGIPQIDYVWDPNLPQELHGYNLSTYPFLRYAPPPQTMDFKCDDRHDGFYANVELKCQVYHQCLFGQRYDFLCANFTAFDQKIFNCQFVSEVDCENSPLFYDRNEALYKTTSTTPAPTAPPIIIRSRFPVGGRRGPNGRLRRPIRPVYYDDYYEYEDQEYEDVPGNDDEEEESPEKAASQAEDGAGKATKTSAAGGKRPRPGASKSIFANPNRPPPRINPPVPNGPGKKAAKSPTSTTAAPVEEEFDEEEEEEVVSPPTTRRTTTTTRRPKSRRPKTTTTTTPAPDDDEFYDYEDEEEAPTTTTTKKPRKPKMSAAPRRPSTKAPKTTTTTTTEATDEAEEETDEVEEPAKPAPVVFDRKAAVGNILKRRMGNRLSGDKVAPLQTEETEEEGKDETPVQVTTGAPTTTTTTEPATKRTTKARPPRPPVTSRTRVPTTVQEETTTTTTEPPTTSTPASEEAQVKEARKPATRRPSPRQIPQVEDEEVEEVEQPVRQTRHFRFEEETEPQVEDVDEDHSDSQQWSIISLFSRVLPFRS